MVRASPEKFSPRTLKKFYAWLMGMYRVLKKFEWLQICDIPQYETNPVFNVEDLIPYIGSFDYLAVIPNPPLDISLFPFIHHHL